MRTRSLPGLAAALALTLAGSAHAYTYGPWGCNLRWDHCYGDGGVANKAFACNTNSGAETLVASVVPEWDFEGLTGIEVVIDLATASSSLPAWWDLAYTVVSCRVSQMTATATPVDPPATTNCPDWAQGNQVGGIASYTPGVHGANSSRIWLGWGVSLAIAKNLSGRQEYFVQRLTISHQKTAGIGGCPGCAIPACIVLTSFNMVSPTPSLSRWLTGPANQLDSDFVTWQGGAGVGTALGSGCPAATPAKRSTWRAVKSMYR